jgi:glycosyltransferase involved in cell wall biosynthesis
MKRAIFFVYVWPEPLSSAAGMRTRELIEILLNNGWECAAISCAGDSPHREALETMGVRTFTADPNVSDIASIAFERAGDAQLVLYDRFVMEEQFGWRARARWEKAFHVVDTQDLHSLRRARERLLKAGAAQGRILRPNTSEMGEDIWRELSSLYRSDGALLVSSFELELLVGDLGFPLRAAALVPFSAQLTEDAPGFTERKGFCFLGNFRHPPNLDSVRYLLSEVWPQLRVRLPSAELHLYGAYPPAEISAHKGKAGIFAHGPVIDHRAALSRHRALLAPLRFGAGIKGKVLEAWGTGTPVVGSEIAFEGLGSIKQLDAVETAFQFHEDEAAWRAAREVGIVRIKNDFSRLRVEREFLNFVTRGIEELSVRRSENIVGQLLRHHGNNSTKYFSRWIEAKRR